MERYSLRRSASGDFNVDCHVGGQALLNHPMFNKGSGFTPAERDAFGLHGLVPPHVSTLDQQARRIYQGILRKSDPLEQYIGLAGLQDRNEVLFYHLMLSHLEEFAPIVYTPTVGQACELYSHHFRRPRGMWITPADRGRIYEVLGNAAYADVRLIVATDNERILGLGDQGAGGIGIPIGKLILYTVAAGIHPTQTLAISLDVGTDNSALRADDLYLGWPHPRLRGEEYDALVDEFVLAVKRRWPKALLQWEDFKKQNAFNLLDRYRQSLPSFNDDIQGTAAVAVAGVIGAGRATATPLEQQRIIIMGAGAAGIGIARQLRSTMRQAGLTGDALTRAIAVLDSTGLLIEGRIIREPSKREFVWPLHIASQYRFDPAAPPDLLATVRALHPTVLIGTTGTPGCFGEQIVRAMTEHCPCPAIFPFSNPASKSEAIPADLLNWTDGRALIATGSPFAPVTHDGKRIHISQGNNVYVFPGVGLGTLISEAREVTDEMFAAAAGELARLVTPEELAAGMLFPPLRNLRAVTARVAVAVAKAARDGKLGRDWPDDAIVDAVAAAMWEPAYPKLIPLPHGD